MKRFFLCCCVWRDEQCPNAATQEDGLCDWCGDRTEDQYRTNPKALISPITGEYLGLGGAGELHDSRPGSPGACWYPDSGRILSAVVAHRFVGGAEVAHNEGGK